MLEIYRVIRDRLDRHLPTTFPRESVGPAARTILKEGVTFAPNDPFARTYEVDDPILDALFPRFKRERAPVVAVISDRIVEKALANRGKYSPLGFAPRTTTDKGEPIERFQVGWAMGMKDALLTAYGEVKKEMEARSEDSPDDPIVQAFGRLQQLESFGETYYENKDRLGFQKVDDGLGTSAEIMVDTLSMIPELYSRVMPGSVLTKEEFLKIAGNSYPFVAELASLHFHSFMSVFEQSYREQIELVSTDNGYRVDLNEKGKSRLRRRPREYSSRRYKVDRTTLGCSALVATNGASPIKKLWDWSVEAAPQVLKTS